MKRTVLPALLLLLAASPAMADLYQWKDDSGIHITDSMEKVPSKYKGAVKVFKEGARESAPQDDPAPPEEIIDDTEGAPALDSGEEYGGETLDWWAESFKEKRSEISGLQAEIETKMDFMKVFEGGRRFGQTYDSESVERYKEYKEELPRDKKRLATLLEELKDLEGRARRAGVPEEIRK